MADYRGEPTMEEILASIRRIIAEDPAPSARTPASRKNAGRQQAAPEEEAVTSTSSEVAADSFEAHLDAARQELDIPAPPETDAAFPGENTADADEDEEVLELTDIANMTPVEEPVILSATAASAATERLQALSDAIDISGAGSMTLDALVREMLRPLLKQWLDANLPDIVDQVVSREIARLTGKGGR